MTTALTFVDGPYGMNKYPGDEIRTEKSLQLYKKVFLASAFAYKAQHLVVCGTFDSLAWIHEQVPRPQYLYRTCVVWHKPDWTGGASTNIKTFAPRFELLLHYSMPNAVFYSDRARVPYGERAQKGVKMKAGKLVGWTPNPLGARLGNVWTITSDRLKNKVGGRTQPNKHSCVKPSELLKNLVLALSNEGDEVHEPFVGSDSLKQVATALNRVYRGWETAEAYFEPTHIL